MLRLTKLLSILLVSLCVYTHLLSRGTASVILYPELLKNITEQLLQVKKKVDTTVITGHKLEHQATRPVNNVYNSFHHAQF